MKDISFYMGQSPLSLSDLRSLQAEHRVLGEMFSRHQAALVGFEFAQSLGDLEEFTCRLMRHMRAEEDMLLPAYTALCKTPPDGRPEILIEEHRKVEESLQEFLAAARSMRTGTEARQTVVTLLERGVAFKSAMESHQRREERTLFTLLCRRLEAEEKRSEPGESPKTSKRRKKHKASS